MHIERIDDAAKRVVAVKLAFGLIADRYLEPNYIRPGFICTILIIYFLFFLNLTIFNI